MKLLIAACFAGVALARDSFLNLGDSDVLALLNDHELTGAREAFTEVYSEALRGFDTDLHQKVVDDIQEGMASFAQAYTTVPSGPACAPTSAQGLGVVKAVAPFPGGPLARVFGFDLAKAVAGLAGGGATSAMVPILMKQSLTNAMGLIKSVLSVVLQVVPPLIPPPVWINQPLTCMPMLTGSNCFGAVLHPITAADFVTADTTDQALNGDISGFPSLYASKVGKTSDAAYKRCFGAYMSMKCGAAFPRCQTPNAHNFVGNRLPVCVTSCLATLVMCPGMWVDDIAGDCRTASVPPMCSQAIFLNFSKLPPQITSFEEANPSTTSCPSTDTFGNADEALYSTATQEANAYAGASTVPGV